MELKQSDISKKANSQFDQTIEQPKHSLVHPSIYLWIGFLLSVFFTIVALKERDMWAFLFALCYISLLILFFKVQSLNKMGKYFEAAKTQNRTAIICAIIIVVFLAVYYFVVLARDYSSYINNLNWYN